MTENSIPNTVQFDSKHNHIDGQDIVVEKLGNHPTSVFLSGFHGHEYKVIGRLRSVMNQLLTKNHSIFGSFIRILDAHPKSTKIQKRLSPDDTDANRVYINDVFDSDKNIEYPVAKFISNLMLENPDLETAWVFHGNNDEDGVPSQPYHIYDCPTTSKNPNQGVFNHFANQLKEQIRQDAGFKDQHGMTIFDGLDTPDLGNEIHDGYKLQPANLRRSNDHTFENWLSSSALSIEGKPSKFKNFDRAVVFEIPEYLSAQDRQRMIQLIFEKLIIPYEKYLKEERTKRQLAEHAIISS